jgi:hypothetical protein
VLFSGRIIYKLFLTNPLKRPIYTDFISKIKI